MAPLRHKFGKCVILNLVLFVRLRKLKWGCCKSFLFFIPYEVLDLGYLLLWKIYEDTDSEVYFVQKKQKQILSKHKKCWQPYVCGGGAPVEALGNSTNLPLSTHRVHKKLECD